MAAFFLDGTTYEYLLPDPGHDPEATHSWTYGQYPKVMATLSLSVGTVDVYAHASRWNPSHILVAWQDDEEHAHWAWIPPVTSAASPTPNGTSRNTAGARKTCAASGGRIGCRASYPIASRPGLVHCR